MEDFMNYCKNGVKIVLRCVIKISNEELCYESKDTIS